MRLRMNIEPECSTVFTDVSEAREWICGKCRSFHYCVCHGLVRLTHLTQMPEFVQPNPYVLQGYRPANLPVQLCWQSLWVWSNESVNIWSHLCGFVFFLSVFFYDNIVTLPKLEARWNDHLVIGITLICFQVCLLLSTGFHLFFCLSERAYQRWLILDLLGVSVGLLGIYLSGIRYSFYCHQEWHNLYLSFFCILAVVTVAAPLHPQYTSAKFSGRRLFLYSVVSLYGLIPACHWLYLDADGVIRKFFPNVLVVYGLSGIAFCFYLFRIPERWGPGKFDFIGSSHQWWHFLVLASFVWWWRAGIDFLAYRLTSQC